MDDDDKQDLTPEQEVKQYIADLEARVADAETRVAELEEDVRVVAARDIPDIEEVEREFKLDHLLTALVRGSPKGDAWDATREFRILESDEVKKIQRDLTTGTDSEGGFLVPSAYLPERFVDLVHDATVVRQLGATVIEDQAASPLYIPRKTADATAYWVAAQNEVTESNVTFGDYSLEPNEVAAYVEMTSRVMRYAVPGVMGIVQESIAGAIARAIDLQALDGSGAANTPVGIRYTDDVHSTTMNATPTLALLNAMVTKLASANTLKGRLGWAMSSRSWQYISTLVDSNGQPLYPITLESKARQMLLGYPVLTSNAIVDTRGGGSDESTIYFGDWSQLVIAEWGGIQFALSDSHASNFTKRITGLLATALVDFEVTYPEAFVYDEQVRNS